MGKTGIPYNPQGQGVMEHAQARFVTLGQQRILQLDYG